VITSLVSFCIVLQMQILRVVFPPGGVAMRRRSDPLIELPSTCVHFWLCGEMDQLVVHAVCKKCGEKGEFVQAPYPWVTSMVPQKFGEVLRWAKSADEAERHRIVEAEY
jgi:hypothetical protein